jgi:hypothetical protein
MSKLIDRESKQKPYEFGDEIQFSIEERIQNTLKHGLPRPLVVLLQRANTKWYQYKCCKKWVLCWFEPGACERCYNAQGYS